MTLASPHAFYLLFASLLVLLLHALSARERRRDVSALALWEGLPGEPQSRAARLRQQLDPLILLQLAVLLALVTALAQPAWMTRSTSLSGLAIVLDGSASMRATDDDDTTAYDRAVQEALSLIERYPATATAVVQLSSRPTILARPDHAHTDVRDALLRSEPTWYGEGTTETLVALLGSLGGESQFERVVVLSDHVAPDLPATFESILVGTADNLALTGFTVRENRDGIGVTALVSVLNDSDGYADATIRIDDRTNQTSLSLLLEPGEAGSFLIPFPTSGGTRFTASLDPGDGFPADNQRTFSLDRPIDVRVHWLGTENRYLMAALRAVAPIRLVDSPADADLTVVHDAAAPASLAGTILCIHGAIEGLITPGDSFPVSQVDVTQPDHALLQDVEPDAFRIRRAPAAALPASASIVLGSRELPLLAIVDDSTRSVVYLAPDILDSNLPITVGFPLLIRNILSGLVRLPSGLAYRSAEVGDPISLAGRGTIDALYDPNDERIDVPDGLSTFRPTVPGFHTLLTDRGAFAIAVNVPAGESSAPEPPGAVDAPVHATRSTLRTIPLWPLVAGVAVLLLLGEAVLHASRRRLLRRAR